MVSRFENLHEVGAVLPAVSRLVKPIRDRFDKTMPKFKDSEVLPRLELGSLDSESKVLTITPENHVLNIRRPSRSGRSASSCKSAG